MSTYLGMDIGGTSIKIGAWDGEQRIAWQEDIALPETGTDHGVKEYLVSLIREFCSEYKLSPAGLGIGSCGLISGGKIFQSPNTPWNKLPLVPLLKNELDWPIWLINDADAFLVQALTTLPDSQAVVLGLTLGTGLGTALWMRNQLYAGGAGISPEGGHGTINYTAAKSTSDIPGTLEYYTGRDAVMRYYHEAGGESATTPKDVSQLAGQGDQSALAAWSRYGARLGMGIASLCNFLSPDYVLIGGGLAAAHRWFEPSMASAVDRFLLKAMPRPDIRVFNAQSDSVAQGAMRYAAGTVSGAD